MIGRVCWFDGSFVRYAGCDFSKSRSPISRNLHRCSASAPNVYCQLVRVRVNIGVGAQSTLGGTTFLPEKYV